MMYISGLKKSTQTLHHTDSSEKSLRFPISPYLFLIRKSVFLMQVLLSWLINLIRFQLRHPRPPLSRTDRKLARGNPAESSIDMEIERGRELNIKERNIIYSWWLYNDSYYPIDCLLLMATLVCPLYISPPSFLFTTAKRRCGNSGHR